MDGLICLRALWDRVAAAAFILGGGLLVLDAGLHARDAVFAANSLSFLTSGGLGGLAALAVGCTLLMSAGFHDEWRKLDGIEAALPATGAADHGRSPAPGPAGPGRWLRAEADRAAGWALITAGAVWLAIGARLVASALYTPDQVAHLIAGGLGALAVLGCGLAVLLVADTRDEERKLDRIDAAVGTAALGAGAIGAGSPGAAPDGSLPARRRIVTVIGVLGLAAGAGLVVMGWWTAADARRVEEAMRGLVLAAAGVGVVAAVLTVGSVLRRRRLARRARAVLTRVVAPRTARPAEAHHNGSNGTRWTAAGLHHFHVAACPALAAIGPEERQPVKVASFGSNLEPCLLCDAGE